MIRWAVVGKRRVPVPVAPSHLAYKSILGRLLREIESVYLEAFGVPAPDGDRTDAIPGLRRGGPGNRVALVRFLQNTDRSRDFSEHAISVLIDGFEQFAGFPDLVDASGKAIVRDANTGFERMIEAQGAGRKVKASIYAIDHRATTSQMSRFLDRFRRDNTGLIRKLIGEQVVRTERIVREGYGEHVGVLSERIREATGTTESHAELLARDQTLKLNSDIQSFRAKSVGAEWYTWITSNDERVRGRPGGKWANAQSNHWRLHGKKFKYTDPPITNEKKGIRLNPGRDFQCRCTASPDLSHIFED